MLANQIRSLRLIALLVLRLFSVALVGIGLGYSLVMAISFFQYVENRARFGGVSYEWYQWFIAPLSYAGGGIFLWLVASWIATKMIPVPSCACPKCGYMLEGKPVDRCPECGLYLGPDFMDPPVGSKDDAS